MMNTHYLQLLFFPLLFLLAACSPAGTTAVSQPASATIAVPLATSPLLENPSTKVPTQTAPSITPESREKNDTLGDLSPVASPKDTEAAPIVVPIAVYIVDSQDEDLSSRRQAEQLDGIFELVNEIWTPAAITMEVQHISRITLPDTIIQAIARGDFQPFFDGAGRDFDVPEPATINAFYARVIGGPNGIVPFDARLFFVADEPTVHHERVSSHEIGHILGLHHTREDAGRLMFSGTNGLALSDEEITVARYTAQGILNRLR
jgi:hypothetical protein